ITLSRSGACSTSAMKVGFPCDVTPGRDTKKASLVSPTHLRVAADHPCFGQSGPTSSSELDAPQPLDLRATHVRLWSSATHYLSRPPRSSESRVLKLVAKDANHLYHEQETIGHPISTKPSTQRSFGGACETGIEPLRGATPCWRTGRCRRADPG